MSPFFWRNISVSTEIPVTSAAFWPQVSQPKALVDPVAFAIAFVSAPIIIGILGAPFLFIPTVGAVLGAPAYLLVGAPLLWRALRLGADKTFSFFLYGARINLIGGAILASAYLAYIAFMHSPAAAADVIVGTGALWLLAVIHGALWCERFGALYHRLRNKNFPK